LATPLRASGQFRVLTDRDARSLDVLRHSAAHVLATAVRRLRPDAKIGFGPSIDDGFYYDFEVAEPFTPEDLAAFENEMRKVTAEKYPFVRAEVNRAQAQTLFADDPLKLERLSELRDDEVISTYTDGPFIDLCRGPHVPDTSRLKHFKLTHTAGAYWRGDSKRQMLQRIYGTAFFKKEDLDAYLTRIEEAKKRDHRVLGKQLDLFMMHQFSPGAVFWTERGTVLFNALNDFIRERQRDDFHEIRTPLLYNKALWEISGHWGKYRENMFLVLDNETGEHDFSLKPMNCPSHYLLYQSKKHSYRELPLRYVTFDVLHRNEVTGALSGLTFFARIRSRTRWPFSSSSFSTTTSRSASRRSSSSRRDQKCGSAATRCGTAPNPRCAPRSRRREWSTSSSPVTARFTDRRSTSMSRTRSDVRGSWAPFSSTTAIPNGSISRTWETTTSRIGRS
jgi:threonyl-tRNA synthetase